MALTEESLGTVFYAQQRYPEALPHFQKELATSVTDERRGYSGLNIAEMLVLLGRYEEAQEAFTAAETRAAKFPPLRLKLMRARARMELTREHFVEARTLANQALAAEGGRDPVQHSQLLGILGLALAGTGNFSQGLRLCKESLEAEEQVGQPGARMLARLALAQACSRAGDRAGVLAVLRGREPDAGKYPESRWRALAFMSRADPAFATPAREALSELERLWDRQTFQTYLTRPDVQQLSRPLLGAAAAIHK